MRKLSVKAGNLRGVTHGHCGRMEVGSLRHPAGWVMHRGPGRELAGDATKMHLNPVRVPKHTSP